jgi:hypothetical protein
LWGRIEEQEGAPLPVLARGVAAAVAAGRRLWSKQGDERPKKLEQQVRRVFQMREDATRM